MSFKLTRCPDNPILKPEPRNPWVSKVVLNPAMLYEDGVFYLYYRAAGHDDTHHIHIGLATSTDGVHFTRTSTDPLLTPHDGDFDGGCIEDPRISMIDDACYMTYAYRPYPPGRYWDKTIRRPTPTEAYGLPAASPYSLTSNVTATALALVTDKTTIKKLGRITLSDVDDRDVVLFPGKVSDRFYRLSRPVRWSGDGYSNPQPAIWINDSASILDWDESRTRLLMMGEEPWEEKKIGASTPPILTQAGWLMLYHGVDMQGVYRVGAALLDAENPDRVIARTRTPILEPEMDYEKSGIYNGCVFPTGVAQVNDTLYVYYGSADQFCCLATGSIKALVNELLSSR